MKLRIPHLSRSRLLPLSLFIVSLGVALLLGLALVTGGLFYLSQRIIPGVWVEEVHLGGMRVRQAAVEIQRRWNLERRILVSDGYHTQVLSPGELGITVDPLALVEEAYAIGREPDRRLAIRQWLVGLLVGHRLEPQLIFDRNQALAALKAWSAAWDIPAQNERLLYENGKLTRQSGLPGLSLNVDRSLAELSGDVKRVVVERVLRLTADIVMPDTRDADRVAGQINGWLSSPFVIHAYDPVTDERFRWEIPPEVIVAAIKVDTWKDGQAARLDESHLRAYLTRIDAELGPDRRLDPDSVEPGLAALGESGALSVPIRYIPTRYTVQPEDTLTGIGWKLGFPYWKLLEANPGLEADSLIAGSELIVPARDALLPLPVVEAKRIKISISQQRLWVYQDGQLLYERKISTGIDRSPTQPGVFQVQSHEPNAYASIWDLTMPNFLGIYEAWPGFTNGIHGLPLLSNGRRLWGDVLGRPASFGCIIVDLETSEELFRWAEDGVVVEIQP